LKIAVSCHLRARFDMHFFSWSRAASPRVQTLLCLWLAWGPGRVRLASSIALVLTGSFLVSFLLAPLYGGTMRHSDGSERVIAGVNSAVAIMVLAAAGLLYILWKTRGNPQTSAQDTGPVSNA
jgi:hypothetical protein